MSDQQCEPHDSWKEIWRIQGEGFYESPEKTREIETRLRHAERIAQRTENFNVEEQVIRMAQTTEQAIRIKIMCKGVEGKALIDSGSTANFMSQDFAEKVKAESKESGTMTVTRFDGTQTNLPLKIANMRYWIQGQHQYDEFRIIPMGDDTELILGYPWMKRVNPKVDWDRKRVRIPRAQQSGEKKNKEGNSPPQQGTMMQSTQETFSGRGETSKKRYPESIAKDSETDIPEFEYIIPKEEYEERKAEVRKRLPKYLWKFEEVFCPRA